MMNDGSIVGLRVYTLAHTYLARALTNRQLDGCESANVGCFLVTAIDGMDAHLVGLCLLKRLWVAFEWRLEAASWCLTSCSALSE